MLHTYGMNFGIAFQLTDDLLDLTQDRETLGKPSCGDVVEGKKTLPILHMREELDESGIARLESMKGRHLTDDDKEWVYESIESTGARQKVEAIARDYAEKAHSAIEGLEHGPFRDSLMGLTEFVLVRGS